LILLQLCRFSQVPVAVACFGSADVFSQGMRFSTDKSRPFNYRQTFAACIVGIMCSAIGNGIWLFFLDQLIPRFLVDFHRPYWFLYLWGKAMTHSLVWGSMSNTMSLSVRRRVSGETLSNSVKFWHENIFKVTRTQLCFWPVRFSSVLCRFVLICAFLLLMILFLFLVTEERFVTIFARTPLSCASTMNMCV
jgi:hypothetical protein